MALIRQADRNAPLADAIIYRLGDVMREGTRQREQARQEAEAIIAAARAERERLISTAREEGLRLGREAGYREGHEAGRTQGRDEAIAECRARLESLLKGWSAELESFRSTRDGFLIDARTEVLRLAAEIARAVVKRELSLRPDAVLEQVQAALSMVSRPSRVRVSVHPDDRALVESVAPRFAQQHTHVEHLELIDDAELERGSCRVRTQGGTIDAGIEEQVRRIVEAFLPGEASS